jgi:transcriptional regulator with XRE-family HTH domain
MEMDSVEKNLKEICRRKGLTLTDVANRMGANPSNLLSSIKGNPKLSTLQDIADALQISVSELLTMRPEKATGVAFVGGQVYQFTKPSANVVQLPVYERYSDLRDVIKEFVAKAVEADESSSIMGLVETYEVFSLAYDHHKYIFLLSLCYANGKTLTIAYDKLEFCDWKDEDTEETVKWSLADVTQEIINDLEGVVITKLESL